MLLRTLFLLSSLLISSTLATAEDAGLSCQNDDKTRFKIALVDSTGEIHLRSTCSKPSFTMHFVELGLVEFEGCEIQYRFGWGMPSKSVLVCKGEDITWANWDSHSPYVCKSAAFTRTSRGWNTTPGLEAWAQAAEACSNTEKAKEWRERKDTWTK